MAAGSADDGASGRVGADVRVVVADAELAALLGDDQGFGHSHGADDSRVVVPPRVPLWTPSQPGLMILPHGRTERC